MATLIADAIRVVLGQAALNGQVLRLPDTLRAAERAAARAALEQLGFQPSRDRLVFTFPIADPEANSDIVRDVLDYVLLTGQVDGPRPPAQDVIGFSTPGPLAERLIAAAGLERGMLVLEPSAGEGAVARRAAQVGCWVECVEADPDRAHRLEQAGFRVVLADFLAEWPKPVFDRVIMAPPLWRQRDFAHVKKACRFLRPGGRLAALVSDGVAFRTNRIGLAFHRLVESGAGTIRCLPPDSLAEAGTAARVAIITIEATASLLRHLKDT